VSGGSAAAERTLQLEGLRIHVREVGRGRPVLLINGLGANTGVWWTLEQALEGFRLIEFDAPGVGRSQTPLRPVSVPRLARLAAAVLDSAGVDRADVVGFSMGGIVAQQLAADAPGRVRRLVLAATTPGLGGVTGDSTSLLNIMAPVRYVSTTLYARSLGGLTGGRARYDSDWVAGLSEDRMELPPTMRGYVGQLTSLATWSGLPLHDPLSPLANGMILAQRLPNARLLVAPGEGHLMLADPDSVVHGPIQQFLDADRLQDSLAWRRAAVVDADQVRAAIARTPQSQPLGAIGAIARRRWRCAERASRAADRV
jgi:pimeloyl-ACP methyl ester carboxylesterase